MKSNDCCKCGSLENLTLATREVEPTKLSFALFFDEDKYFIRFQGGEPFEIVSCWTCGGLELGDIASEDYQNRANCECDKLSHFVQNDKNPIFYNSEHNFYAFFVAYNQSEDDLSDLMLFCPFCSGKLFDRHLLADTT